MTVPEALEMVKQVGAVEIRGGNLRLKFPEKERAKLQPPLYTLRRCKSEAMAMLGAIPLAAVNPKATGAGVDANRVEIALRWYCSTCGTGGVVWHPPAVTCDAKARAITRAHSERQAGCPRFDYRVIDSDMQSTATVRHGEGRGK